ncbi:ABC transporter permease [Clostridium folliculivorans]|uniref:Sugar ABC transporter permease n=1 Tax=Clostridium folliculivorans TaxID=2886038 RepID=A0A9W5XYX1_9CLOT|nr:ABC transporter permease subunit [Clostridium folliculivorans]GKU23456.1 sugar ABC transporter permease [Clostridium folliculivorans]GKU29572.1 sugar ABC transporter permease [Clostridium folliculivorans]
MKRNAKWRSSKSSLPLLMLTIPGLLYLLINNYIPMVGAIIAFKSPNFQKGIFGGKWVGFDNFAFLFKTKDAWIMTRNTILYNLGFIILGTIGAVFVAILMTELTKKVMSKFYQNALILPSVISMVIVSYIAFSFLNSDSGLINKSILKVFGLPEISWYSEPKYWPFILVFVFLWKTTGYSSLVYIASIAGIDKSIYEAAQIDGAGKLRQIKDITLPLLKPTIIIMTLMAVGRIMNSDFGLFYQVPMNSGALYNTTQTIDTFVYRAMMQLNDTGMAAASGLYQSLVGFILVIAANGLIRKIDPENSIF